MQSYFKNVMISSGMNVLQLIKALNRTLKYIRKTTTIMGGITAIFLVCLLFYLNIDSDKYIIFKYILDDNLFTKHF